MTSRRPPQPPAPQERNRAAWMSIADFLARHNLRLSLARQQRAAAAQETRA